MFKLINKFLKFQRNLFFTILIWLIFYRFFCFSCFAFSEQDLIGFSFDQAVQMEEKHIDHMFDCVRSFLEQSANVKESEFDDFVRNYMAQRGGQPQVFSKDLYLEKVSNDNYLEIFRGVNSLDYAKNLREGKVFVGGAIKGVNGALLGSGVYATPYVELARLWASEPVDFKPKEVIEDEVQKGEIIRMALPKDAKFVSFNYLTNLFNLMIEKNRSYFKDYIDKKNILGDLPSFWSFSFKIKAEYVKQKKGFDFYAGSDKKSFEERLKELNALEESLGISLKKGESLENLSVERRNNFDEYMKLVEEKLKNFNGDFLTDKVYYLSQNMGFLAQLMGFDFVFYKGDPAKQYGFRSFDENFLLSEILVVKFDNLIIFDEVFEEVPLRHEHFWE